MLITTLVLTSVGAVRLAVTYRAIEIGADAVGIGVIASGFALLALAAGLPAARLIARVGERQVVLSGALLIAGAATALPWLGDVAAIALDQAALGLGHLLVVLGCQTMIAELAEDGQRESQFGWWSVAGSMGATAGPLLVAILVVAQTGSAMTPVFVVAAFVALAAAACVAFLPRSVRQDHGHSGRRESPLTVERGARAGGPILVAMFSSVTVLLATDLVVVYFPLLASTQGLAPSTVGFLLAAQAAASIVPRVFMGWLSGRFGARRVLLIGMFGAGLAIGAVPAWTAGPLILVAMLVMGVGLGIGQPMTMAWVANEAPEGRRARAMAIRLTGNRLGQLVVPVVAGAVAGSAGVAALFFGVSAALWTSASLAARTPRWR